METGSQGWRRLTARLWQKDQAVPHLHADNQEEELGSKTDNTTQGSIQRNKAAQPLTVKTSAGCSSRGRNSQPHRRVHWKDPQGPRTYTNPHTQESAPEGPTLLVGSRRSD